MKRPEIFKIAENIFFIRESRLDEGGFSANTVIFTDSDAALVVDPGWGEASEKELLEALQSLGIKPNKLILMATHSHKDHFPLVCSLASKGYGRAYVSQRTKEIAEEHEIFEKYGAELYMEQWDKPENGPDWKWFHSDGESSLLINKLNDYSLVNDGDIISFGEFDFEIINTSGHSYDHISIYEPNKRLLLAGDAVMEHINPLTVLPCEGKWDSVGSCIASLERLKGYKVDMVIPGHGKPFSNGNSRIEQLIEIKKARREEVFEIVAANGEMSAYELALKLPFKRSWEERSSVERFAALCEVQANLEHLYMTGRLSRRLHENKFIYGVK